MRKRIGVVAALIVLAGPAAGAVLDGVWTGSYTCAQGETGLELFVSTEQSGALSALFHFGDGGFGRPEGCFAMTGASVPGGLTFTASRWITRPYGYVTVDLLGSVRGAGLSGSSYSGWVAGPGCTNFTLQRAPPAPIPAVCRSKSGLVS